MTEVEKILAVFHKDCYFSEDVLIEKFKDGTSMKRDILWCNYESYCIIRLDTQNRPSWYPFFQNKNGLNSICDYIIFVEDTKQVNILLIEMKSGEESPQSQLRFTENFIKFILRRMNICNELQPEKDYYLRKIGISDRPPRKKSTNKVVDALSSFDENNYCKLYHSTRIRIDNILVMPVKSKHKGKVSLSD